MTSHGHFLIRLNRYRGLAVWSGHSVEVVSDPTPGGRIQIKLPGGWYRMVHHREVTYPSHQIARTGLKDGECDSTPRPRIDTSQPDCRGYEYVGWSVS